MNIRIDHLEIRAKQKIENIHFSDTITFLHGPVGTGKSSVARLIDYCFGGDLERTPAIQQEFVSVILRARLGEYDCTFERSAEDTQSVRVTWMQDAERFDSLNAPLDAAEAPLLDAQVFNLSDLMFHLCGIEPIKVPKKSRDPDSPLIRLSFRDIWWYCYLDQTHLDSSFFRLEDPFRGRKSQDAMRFFTGLYSERMNQLQGELYRAISDQHGAREAIEQIRRFMAQFDFGSENELAHLTAIAQGELIAAEEKKAVLESERATNIHPTDGLRVQLRELSRIISELQDAIDVSRDALTEQESLRAELITTKIKAGRIEKAGRIFESVDYINCPQCGCDVSSRPESPEQCRLCGVANSHQEIDASLDSELMRREINDRIDQVSDSLNRRRQALGRSQKDLQRAEGAKVQLDRRLQNELSRYDSAFIEGIRSVDRDIATLEERLKSLTQLQEMPRAINDLEERVGMSQGRIDRLRSIIEEERARLRFADKNTQAIAEKFKAIMLEVGFPGVSEEDVFILDPRNWKPIITHSTLEWGFWDTGSGGKKTLFNVCYALAIHEIAQERKLPVPNILIIDSPTKNISDDENPDLVHALYRTIYRVAIEHGIQFLLIDSELVEPEVEVSSFSHQRMANEQNAPSLISYYSGP